MKKGVLKWLSACLGDGGWTAQIHVRNGVAIACDSKNMRVSAKLDAPAGVYDRDGNPLPPADNTPDLFAYAYRNWPSPTTHPQLTKRESDGIWPSLCGNYHWPKKVGPRTGTMYMITDGGKGTPVAYYEARDGFVIVSPAHGVPSDPDDIEPPAPAKPKLKLWVHPESDCIFLRPREDESPYEDQAIEVPAAQLRAGDVIESVGLGTSVVRPSMDFETYSEAGYIIDEQTGKVHSAAKVGNKGGLPLVGTPVYAEHPSTEVLCLYYDLKDGKGRRAFIPGGPQPTDLLEHIAAGGDIEAWNVTFEWYIWNMVCVKKYGWPPLNISQTYCVMAKARRYSLPGPLGLSAKALGTADKDKTGKQLINQLCRPVSATKNRPQTRRTPQTDPQKFAALYAYCDRDVEAEDEIAARVPEMTPSERDTWLADQRINARGVQVDTEALDNCLFIMDRMTERFTQELQQLSGGAVNTVGEIEKLRNFIGDHGCMLPDMTSDTVSDALKRDDLTPIARRALEIRDALAGANIKKLPTLKAQLSSDGRLRNQYTFFGPATGRWSAGGVQLQNITSKGPAVIKCNDCGRYVTPGCKVEVMGSTGLCPECGSGSWDAGKCVDGKWSFLEWNVDAVEWALRDIATRDLDHVMRVWGDPAGLLAGCLRGLLIAGEGKKLVCCDFSAIEAVGLAALSRCEWRLDVFKTHGKIYEMSASKISGVPFEDFMQYKKDNGFDHPLRKSLGKVAELASGYQGWIGAWKAFGAEKHFADDDEMKEAILAWRDASPEIVEFWGGQWRKNGRQWSYEPYGLEGAAINAVLNPGQCFAVIDITFGVWGDCLYCRLPSGRFLQYHEPRLIERENRFGRGTEYELTFMTYNTNPKNGPNGWTRVNTYGGRLTENVDQAACADIQAWAMKMCENNGYPVVMHTHDELIAEVDENFGSIEEMAALMSTPEPWREWWPVRAAGWQGKRYRKD